jgi:DNA-binding response OmpR family regulator
MKKQRIYVIDDSKTGLETLRLVLEDVGYEVATFESPLLIAEAVIRNPPHLILIDVLMPGLQGDKVLPIIRSMKMSSKTRLVLYSVKPIEELRRLATECGADGFMQKTGDPDEIVEMVGRWLKGVDA